jgi:hypothetical protein
MACRHINIVEKACTALGQPIIRVKTVRSFADIGKALREVTGW